MTPIISGTIAGQTVAAGNALNPFTNTTVTDPNGFTADTITISLLDSNGNATDANGTLVLNNGGQGPVTFNETSSGVYVLQDTSAFQLPTSTAPLNAVLPDLQFIAASGDAAGTTTTLAVHLSDTFPGHFADDSTTKITVGGTGGSTPAPTTPIPTVTPTAIPTTVPTATATPNQTATSFVTNGPAGTGNNPYIHENHNVPSGQVDSLTTGDGQLTIDQPGKFLGAVDFTNGDIDLNGLAKADSYSFKNDMLTIWSGGTAIDRLHMTADSTSAFTVAQTQFGVSIYTAQDTNHPTGGTVLPSHS